jgi:enoyl-CoA hydratase/carnithine racemase
MNLETIQILNPTIRDDHTLILALNHGRVNEMGSDELRAWESLTKLLKNGEIRTLITTSDKKSKKGTPIFIAGANVTEREDWNDNQIRAHVRWQRNTLQALRRAPIFHICVVPGIALGWGTEFLLTADYRITTPQSRFGLPETSLGILPGAGGTSDLWQDIGIAHALRLGMTGEQINSKEACAIGLCQEEHPDQNSAMERAFTLADKISKNSPTAVAAFKQALLASVGRGANLRQGLEAQAYEHCVNTQEAAIGRAHFGSKEPTQWGSFKPFSL